MKIRATIVGLIGLTLIVPSVCRADYIFSTSNGGTIPFDSAGNTLLLSGQAVSPELNFENDINIQDVELITTASSPNFINDTVPFSFILTLNQIPGVQGATAGTGSVTATGSILISRSDTGGEISSLASFAIPPLTIGNTLYLFSSPSYAAPTVNSLPGTTGAGNLTIDISPGALIPEPSTLLLLTAGAIGLLWGRRRLHRI